MKRKTREQRRIERLQSIAMTAAMVVIMAIATVLAVRAFATEQPISGGEYRAQIEALERD